MSVQNINASQLKPGDVINAVSIAWRVKDYEVLSVKHDNGSVIVNDALVMGRTLAVELLN